MQTKMIEASNGFNWGKFLLGRLDTEWFHVSHLSEVAPWEEASTRYGLLEACGWSPEHLWVLDLQTGEGAFFKPRSDLSARADLDKHRMWVCPMFEPFLTWLYDQDLSDLAALPHAVRVEGASALYGHRRSGSPDGEAASS